jgi:threonine dehydrogenase-like Zn-dependent dehydrogenase
MKTLVLTQPGKIELVSTPEPGGPAPGEALVRTLRVGVCGSDLHAYNGRQMFLEYPRVLGHELAVEVLESAAEGWRTGDIACVEPFLNCGRCAMCAAGRTNCCVALKTLGVHTDGGMRERFVIPAAKLHRAEGLTLEQMATVEPLCIGHHAVRRAAVAPGESVLVVGAGPIGLAVFEGLRGTGARVTVAERSPFRRKFLRRELGAETVENADGLLADVVIDATGAPAAMNAAPKLAAHGGRVVFVGHHPGPLEFSNPVMHARELTVLFSRNADARDFRWVISRLQQRVADSAPWIAPLTKPERVAEEFPRWMDPELGVVKPVIDFV